MILQKSKKNNNEDPQTFKIWGLTAYVAHQVAQLCKPQAIRGFLYRWMDDSGTSNDTNNSNKQSFTWSQRYFVMDSADAQQILLHQYDSEQHASECNACTAATEKNKLVLDDSCRIKATSKTTTVAVDGKYAFTITALGGRVQWTLAAMKEQNREEWISALRVVLSIITG